MDRSILPIFQSKLRELNDKLNSLQASLDRMYRIKTPRYSYEENDFSLKALYGRMFQLYIDMRTKDIKKCEGEIRRFMWLKNKALGKEMKGELDIEMARTFPIGDLMKGQPTGKGTGRVFYKCEIHNEKTGSFVWYKEKNKFKCFGCGIYGDVIELYMKLNGVDFKEAVKFLQSY